ncbi:non-ribosomal peptide synthetase [Synechocystis sp. PCC 7509]|uniref:non-ribosomal peptide synthetase n=1 Tax=Synechocystis sp. PCC 7509 TaxID=927677 RepID=UPI0002ABF103|nr:amino acid adenylation domain-containing protein [Synechocystis sp. PCC 7509]
MKNIKGNFSLTQEQVIDFSLLSSREKEQILKKWNNTKTNYPQNKCIHQLFEEQVKKTPQKIAVRFEDRQLTYQQLNQRANQVARYLQKANVVPETMVGICLERSLDLIVGLLGILKAGCSYVPLDPAYPYDRLAFMLQDLQLPVLLTELGCLERLPVHAAHTVIMDEEESAIALCRDSNLDSNVTANNLAYTIYNSGTGKPKGVQISHQAVVNFLSSMRDEPGMNAQDVMIATTTMSFNIASLEIYLPLIVGAEIVLVSREVAANSAKLAQSLAQGITVMQAIPSTWRSLLASGWQGNKQLKVLCGGEVLPKRLAQQLLTKVRSVWNMYGAPETTSWSTICQVKPNQTQIFIGRPIANTQIYLLDHLLRRKSDPIKPVPVGVVGEMWIGGASLACGYFNREQMVDKFVPNPFSDKPKYLYKTGDLARYLPNGTIEFIGRIDNQVKIRGFRVDLEDIETTLAQHCAVRETVVVAREDLAQGDKYLAAYLVLESQFFPKDQYKAIQLWHTYANHPEEKQNINKLVRQLQALLREELPEHAIPSVFVVLEALPVTSNGKVDRRALPESNRFRPNLTEEFVTPTNLIEEKLAEIWA